MISEREILNLIQQELESLNLFQTIRQPVNANSDLKLLEMLPDLTQFPAAVLRVKENRRQDTHLASMQVALTVIGQYFGLDTERNACETVRETAADAFRQTLSTDFENRGQALIMLDEIVPLPLGNEFMAWEIALEVKILNY